VQQAFLLQKEYVGADAHIGPECVTNLQPLRRGDVGIAPYGF